MRHIYIPTIEEFKIIELLSGNDSLYKYILTKTVEKLINEGGLIKNTDKELTNIPELATAICYIYPQEIMHSDIAKNDLNLFVRLLSSDFDYNNNSDNLNYLHEASKDVQYNEKVVLRALKILNLKLQKDPAYRFNYRRSDLLDSIFGVDYLKFIGYDEQIKDILMSIDPIYLIKFLKTTKLNKEIAQEQGNKLKEKIDTYSLRYGINPSVGEQYKQINILKRPDEKVRRLVRELNKR